MWLARMIALSRLDKICARYLGNKVSTVATSLKGRDVLHALHRGLHRMCLSPLPNELSPIVTAVGDPMDRVNVEFTRLLIGEVDAGVVIHLDETDSTLDAEIERVIVTEFTGPCDSGFGGKSSWKASTSETTRS